MYMGLMKQIHSSGSKVPRRGHWFSTTHIWLEYSKVTERTVILLCSIYYAFIGQSQSSWDCEIAVIITLHDIRRFCKCLS